MTNIYVGNLDFSTSEDELLRLFQTYGTVESVHIITDRATEQSRGFAFVEMPNDNEAAAAIKALHRQTIGSRTVVVNEARHKPESAFSRSSRERKYGR